LPYGRDLADAGANGSTKSEEANDVMVDGKI
jgi:hypothetical protein